MNTVSSFPTLTAPCPLTFISNLSNTDEVPLVANLSKTYISKSTARSNNAFLSKLPTTLPNALARNGPD